MNSGVLHMTEHLFQTIGHGHKILGYALIGEATNGGQIPVGHGGSGDLQLTGLTSQHGDDIADDQPGEEDTDQQSNPHQQHQHRQGDLFGMFGMLH